MGLAIKNALAEYFRKLTQYSEARFGEKPKVTFSEKLNKNLILFDPDEDGEVSWHAVFQEKAVDWAAVESRIGFVINDELKDYYGTYYFLSLNGVIGNIQLFFYPIDGHITVESMIEQQNWDAKAFGRSNKSFLIGNAIVNDDDAYFIIYENDGDVFFYDNETHRVIKSGLSLHQIIGSMEARE